MISIDPKETKPLSLDNQQELPVDPPEVVEPELDPVKQDAPEPEHELREHPPLVLDASYHVAIQNFANAIMINPDDLDDFVKDVSDLVLAYKY